MELWEDMICCPDVMTSSSDLNIDRVPAWFAGSPELIEAEVIIYYDAEKAVNSVCMHFNI
jgi:hypothetical protein